MGRTSPPRWGMETKRRLCKCPVQGECPLVPKMGQHLHRGSGLGATQSWGSHQGSRRRQQLLQIKNTPCLHHGNLQTGENVPLPCPPAHTVEGTKECGQAGGSRGRARTLTYEPQSTRAPRVLPQRKERSGSMWGTQAWVQVPEP